MRTVGRHDQVCLQHATQVPVSLPDRIVPRQSPYGGPTLLRLGGRVQPQPRILDTFATLEVEYLQPVYEALAETFSYDELKIFRLYFVSAQ